MAIKLLTPSDITTMVANQARSRRLALNLTQKTLAQRSGVSLAVIKQFEHTGKIAFHSLLKLALVLDCLDDFEALFTQPHTEKVISLDDLLNESTRQRGRE